MLHTYNPCLDNSLTPIAGSEEARRQGGTIYTSIIPVELGADDLQNLGEMKKLVKALTTKPKKGSEDSDCA